MAGAPKDLSDGTIKLQDGTATPNSITLAIEDGDLSFAVKQPDYSILDRGSLSHLRQADEEEIEGSFSIVFTEMIKQTTTSTPTPYEVATFTGGASGWVSTNSDGGDVKTLSMLFEIVDPDASRTCERITFTKVRIKNIKFDEGRPNKFACDFSAYMTKPTVAKYTP